MRITRFVLVAGLVIGLPFGAARAAEAPGVAPPPHNVRKNRYISFVPNNAGVPVAFLVELVQSDLFPDAVGVTAWVGAPIDSGCTNPADPPETCAHDFTSDLECAPVFRIWDGEGVVHIGAPWIVPASSYSIRAIPETGAVSAELILDTIPEPFERRWADVVGPPPKGGTWTGPDGFVNVSDLQAAINTQQGTPSSAPVTWIDLNGEIPNHIINISDIQMILQGIAGWAYPFISPADYDLPGPIGCGDCNGTDTCDICDVLVGGLPDCDGDLIPDECEEDCNLDGTIDDCETDARLRDCNGNGTCDGIELDSCTGEKFCADCNGNSVLDGCEPDADGDGLPDECETGTGVYVMAGDTGTNPISADSDGDGLDDWEELFGTLEGDPAGLDLPTLGADPNHKTLFVELDWFEDSINGAHNHRPTDAAIQMVIDAFAAAPLSNPDGTTGIELVVDYGQGGQLDGGELIGTDGLVDWPVEFSVYRAAHFAANRMGYFRYGILAHSLGMPASGIAEVGGDDFMVTLENSLSNSAVSKTIMHEVGHNLSLHHGGFEALNYKPNYNSIMNYRYQFPGVDTDCDSFGEGSLDYSHGNLAALDENDLDENSGVCGPGFPVDWNLDLTLQAGLALNINCQEGDSAACGAGGSGVCNDNVCEILEDSDDWAQVILPIAPAARAGQETVECTNLPPATRP